MVPWSTEETVWGWLLMGGIVFVFFAILLTVLSFDFGAWKRSRRRKREEGKL